MNSDLIIIKNLIVQNANAISSAVSVGFPAVTSFMGFVHAIQRKINEVSDYTDIAFTDVGIVCHDFKFHAFKGVDDFDYSLIGTANPLKKNNKTREWERPPFIPEGRCNLNVSLVIKAEGMDDLDIDSDDVVYKIENLLRSNIKLAGGDILDYKKVYYKAVASNSEERKILCTLMPGYSLIERKKLMLETMEEGKDALESLLDFLVLRNRCEINEEGVVNWKAERKTKGWLVPVAVGFQGISEIAEPGKTKCQRSPEYCHQFAEAIVTLGEFKMPFKLNTLEDIFWHYEYHKNENLYLCVNEKGE